MRTRNIYDGLVMTAAALLCLAGCKKDEEGEKIMLGTQFEKAVSAQKTYLGENNYVCWSTGDQVNVNGTECEVSAEGVEVDEDESYYAVYPAEGSDVNATGGTVVIPATQTYTQDEQSGRQVLNGPMAARLDGKSGTLYFRNLYSLLKVTVSADDKAFTVNSITVTATGDNARALAGSYTFTFNGATTEDATSAPAVNPYAETRKDSSTKVSLACVSVQVSANSDKDFYLAVHPLVGQNLKVEVQGMLDGKSAIYTHTTATTVGLSRSRIGGLGINLQQLPVLRGIGEFTVNASGDKVTFSPGNLQWSATSGGSTATTHAVAGGGTAVGTWRFAEHQWDYVGDATNGTVNAGSVKCNNALIASDYTGWIDLFGWGTSGWNNGNAFYQPYDCSNATTEPYTSSKGYGYGPINGANCIISLSNKDYKNADWGVYNAIYNPESGNIDPAGTWRTLTEAEWAYLLGVSGGRSNEHSGWWIYNMVKITDVCSAGVTGLIIYPDGVTAKPEGVTADLTQNDNTAVDITKAEFETLEAMGCVFLPAASNRKGTSVSTVIRGDYWSSMCGNSYRAYYLYFSGSGYVSPSSNCDRYRGLSVRLVKDVK